MNLCLGVRIVSPRLCYGYAIRWGCVAMYRAGKLASRPNSLHLYVARPQTWSPEIAVLLQEQPTPKFAWGGVDFEINPIWSVPGKAMRYSIRHGSGETNLHVVIVNSVIACGPRSNRDLTYEGDSKSKGKIH